MSNGSLLDANNDGIIDLSDIDIIKENIKIEKQENINFIVENSTGENTEFLSNVLNVSDAASIGQSMNQILETNDYLVASVITNLADEDNAFLTTSNMEEFYGDEEFFDDEMQEQFDQMMEIKENIFTQMLSDSDDENNNIEVIGSIFAKSDAENIALMMDTIQTVGETNTDSTLALEVLSSMADNESFDDMDFGDAGQDQYNQMMEQAVFSAADSEDGAMMLANIMTEADADMMSTMMDTIQTVGETNTDSTLALEVLSSMAENESFDDMNFGDEEFFGDEGAGPMQEQFDQMMEQAVFSAADSEDGAMMLANIMTEADADMMSTMMDTIQTVGETNTDSTLALEVLSSMADNESFDDMDFGDAGQDQYDQMMEQAVFSAADSEDGAMMLANIMTEADADMMSTMMDTIQTVGETNTDSTLALEVLSSMADSGESLDDMNFGYAGQDQYDQMMEQAVFSAADSEEGAMMLANVMTEADADTVGLMFDYISDVSENDKYSTLGAEVLSSVVSTAATNNEYFDTEKMDQLYDFIDTTTDTTTAEDDGVADDMYDASGFSMMPPYNHRETGTLYNMAGFDRDGNSEDDGVADDMYDAGGFSMMPPYNHRETGTLYNMAGFDRDGNSDPGAGGTYDAAGFDSTGYHKNGTLYDNAGFDYTGYHKNGTLYDSNGYDRYGNSDPGAGGSDPTVTWMTQASSSAAASYTTSDTINLSASATTTGDGVTYSISGKADLTFDAGTLSGSPTVANSPYSIEIYAEDDSCYGSCTGVSKLTDTISFTVTDGGDGDPTVTWMTQASSSAAASYTTSDTINLSASATTTGDGVTYSISGKADLTFDAGTLSGSPTVANSPYSIEIYAEDDSCYGSCTGVSKLTDTISFTVTDGGSYDARGFSTVDPFFHQNTGNLYDDDGYNASGWTNAVPPVYNYLYDDNISP